MKFGRSFQLVMLAGFLAVCLAQRSPTFFRSQEVILRPECYEKKDIVVILDASRSIKAPMWEQMKKYVAKLVGHFKIAEEFVRFDIFSFHRRVNLGTEIKFGNYNGVQDLQKKIRGLERKGSGTKLGNAISHVNHEVLRRVRENATAQVWIVTDGKDRDEALLKKEVKKMDKTIPIDVLAIHYGDEDLIKYYTERLKKYVNDLVMIDNMNEFSDKFIKNLADELCVKKPLEPDPEEICYAEKEIIIVLDASSSIDEVEWLNMKKFVADLVQKFHVAQNRIRFDVFSFNMKVQEVTEIKFDGYENMRDLRQKIMSMTGLAKGTKLGTALQYINDDVLGRTRPSTKDKKIEVIVWVVTDGKDHDPVLLNKQRQRLGNKAKIHVLGITNKNEKVKNYYDKRLRPFVDRITKIDNMHDSFTNHLLVKVANELCKDKIEKVDEKECPIKTDIVVVLDSSNSIKPNEWTEMKNFVSDLVGNFDVKNKMVQFDIFRFNRNVVEKDEISFGSYSSLKELQGEIQKMKKSGGGTYLGSAIHYVNNDILKRGRPKVKKQVLIVTDGISDDEKRVGPELDILKKSAEIDVLAIDRSTNPEMLDYWTRLESHVDYFLKIKDSKEKFTRKLLASTVGKLCD